MIVRSAAGNIELRNALRRSWLDLKSMGKAAEGMAYRFLVDSPTFLQNTTGPGASEQRKHKDLLVMGPDWIHPQFKNSFLQSAVDGHGYKEMAWGGKEGEFGSGMNYAREWDLQGIMWSTFTSRHFKRFIVNCQHFWRSMQFDERK